MDYYGQKVPLNQVATISIPEARLVIIQPWDRSVLPEIEKAIQKSELSVNPNNDGKVIRIAIPPLTEERRKELVKVAKNIAEKTPGLHPQRAAGTPTRRSRRRRRTPS